MLFLTPIRDFVLTTNKKEFNFVFLLPGIITLLAYIFIMHDLNPSDVMDNLGNFINLLAILIGFSITGIAILASGGSKNLDKLRATESAEKKLDGKPVDLYKLLLINLIAVVIFEIIALTINLFFSFLYSSNSPKDSLILFYTLDCFLFLVIIFLNLKNVTNLYFSLFRNIE